MTPNFAALKPETGVGLPICVNAVPFREYDAVTVSPARSSRSQTSCAAGSGVTLRLSSGVPPDSVTTVIVGVPLLCLRCRST